MSAKMWFALAFLIAFAMFAANSKADCSYSNAGSVCCTNGHCEMSTRPYVYEDGTWKEAEKARSTKVLYEVKFLEKDPLYGIELVDVNETAVTWKVSIGKNLTKYDLANIKFSLRQNLLNATSGKFFENKSTLRKFAIGDFGSNSTHYFATVTVAGQVSGRKYSFGGNSTTVTMQNADSQILEDVTIQRASGTNQDAAGLELQVESGNWVFGFMAKINITNMSTKVLSNFTFCGLGYEFYGGGITELRSYHVTNKTWTEETATGNSYPITYGQYNSTAQNSRATTGITGWVCFNELNGAKADAANGYENTSFYVEPVVQAGVVDTYLRDKEYATGSSRPYVTAIYDDPPAADSVTATLINPTNTTVTSYYNVSFMVNGTFPSYNVTVYIRGGNITGETYIGGLVSANNATTVNYAFNYQSNGVFNITLLAYNGSTSDTDTVFYTQSLPSPKVYVYVPENTTYLQNNITLNVSVDAYTDSLFGDNPWIWWAMDGVWNRTHNTLNPLGGTDGFGGCDAPCRRDSVSINVLLSSGVHNLTVASRDYGTYATNWTVVYFSVPDYYNVTYTTPPTFINETKQMNLTATYGYNPAVVSNITTKLYVGDETYDFSHSKNATFVTNTYSYSVPLVALNNTNRSLIYQSSVNYVNGSVGYFNSSLYNFNVTYSAWLSSVAFDAVAYLEGDAIGGIVYAYNYTPITMTVWLNLEYNATRNLTYQPSHTGTPLRTYTQSYPAHTPSAVYDNISLNATAVFTYGSVTRTMAASVVSSVYRFNITNCTDGTPALIIAFFNETDFAATNGSLPLIYINITSGSTSKDFAFQNLTDNATHQFCLNPSWATPRADIFFQYGRTGSVTRQYYANNVSLSSTPQTINAYILGDEAYYTNIYVYDENSAKYPNGYVQVLKMNPATAVYTAMFVGKTDNDGIMTSYLKPLVQPYKFIITDSENGILYQTRAENIPCINAYGCPPYEKHIYMDSTSTAIVDFSGLSSIFAFDNTTGDMSITVSDTSGVSESIMITIYTVSEFGGRAIYYNSTTVSSSVSYSTTLSNSTEEYLLVVSVQENGEYYAYVQESMVMTRSQPLGAFGGILAVFVILGLSAFGYYVFEHIGGLVGCGLAVVLCSQYVLKLLPIDAIGVSGILVSLALVGYAVSRNG